MPGKAKIKDGSSPPKKARNRRDFLKLTGIGAAGAALLGGAVAFELSRNGDSAPSLGVSPDNDGITNRENLVEALRHSKRRVSFPPGDYVTDNSKAQPERGLNPNFHVVIDHFEGELAMEEGARFVFTDNTRRGLFFHGGKGAKFVGLSTIFEEHPPLRVVPEECMTFTSMIDTEVRNTFVDGSASVGLLFWLCVRPAVLSAEIINTMADGLHFANCQDARAEDISTNNTGDDGLAFIDYEDGRRYTGGYAKNITVRDSKARGIAVVGQSGVVIDGFEIDGTNASGLMCAHDAYWKSRVSDDVVIKNGEVRNAGTVVDPAGKTGNKYGIEIDAVDSVEFENIKVFSSTDNGVSGVATREVAGVVTKGDIRLSNIEAHDSGAVGFELQGRAQDGESMSESRYGTYDLDGLLAKRSGQEGVVVLSAASVRFGTLETFNASRESESGRAFWFADNASVAGGELRVEDDQSPPTGYKVLTDGNGSGTLGAVYDGVVNGDIEMEGGSKLPYTTSPA